MVDEQGWLEVGARVAEARKARGYSQDHLASELGVDRTAITKIEAGRRQVNSLELVRLSEVLERPLQWFVSLPPHAVISRRAAVAGRRSDQRSDLAVEDIARDVAVLADVRVLTPHSARGSLSAIRPRDGADRRAEEAASEARSLLGADPAQPLHDLADLVERVGLFPYSLPLGEEAADGAYVEVDGIGVALVNGEIDPGRRRSTLAHELGHHLFGDAYSVDWGTDTDAIEAAIDAFAIDLLLPRAGITPRWHELRERHEARPSAITISAEYRVSWTAALRQLRKFELVSTDEYKALDSRSPTRADYLECNLRVTEELRPPYVPTGVSAAAIRAYRTHRLSAERVVEILRDEIEIDDLPIRDEIPLEALRGELH
ncbi:XRE family transcriptional regulator [Actinomadura sp. ATCC 31491]|uniref:XRE family transcriptional regulator n=1 Tax=Actinomadura luzonensis TaxID=2805427 RepID=A0ABT0G4I0_9ACTN|nr:XRE family transcriptional regulator [Actinomadura luzonensis]MCK2219503.1 XRE family transcriptional regulator [Actinomadura luzonensis]